MLGHKLVQAFKDKFHVFATLRGAFKDYKGFRIFDEDKTIDNLYIENAQAVRQTIEKIQPDVVLNAVGIIKQLPSSKDVIKTLTVNSIFPHRLSELSHEIGFRLICISTDCVFSGEKGNYSEEDIPDALDLYGKSKNLGEVIADNCLTIRTSIIGRELITSHSLIEWFLSNKGKKIKGFSNAVYSGFPTIVFADIIANLIVNYKKLEGLYHISSDAINKFELLKLVNEYYDADVEIERYEDFKLDRSLNSAKFKAATGFVPMSWDEMIERMAKDPTPYDKWRK